MDFDNTYGPESWEGYSEFYENEDWVGLLKFCEIDAKKHTSDLYAQQRYAEALNLNKKYKEALDFIIPLYKDNHDFAFGDSEIVDALYGLGKTKEDFDWISRPVILTLDSDTVDFCVDLLKNRSRGVRITDLYQDLLLKTDYCKFNEQELAEFLVRATDKFVIKPDKDFIGWNKLKLKRK